MIFKFLHQVGVRSDMAYAMGMASIVGSIGMWARRNERDVANAERLGIFIGLWAPTFMIIGNGLKVEEEMNHSGSANGKSFREIGQQAGAAVQGAAAKVQAAV